MKNSARLPSRPWITCALLPASLTFLVSCSSFQGPGELRMGATSGTGPAPASVSEPVAPLAMTAQPALETVHHDLNFDWPVDEARMTRGFFAAPSKKKRAHWGVDLANHKGTPIVAAEKGTVIYTGRGFRGYGKLVVIEHNEEWATLYSHLDKFLVKEGDVVGKGDKIALMGRTGRATGVHLHFEIRRFRQPVNPLAYLPQVTGKPGYAGLSREETLQLSH